MGGACPSSPPLPPPSQAGEDRRPPSSVHCPWLLPPWPPPPAKFEDPEVSPSHVKLTGASVEDNFPEEVIVCRLKSPFDAQCNSANW